MNRSSKCRTRTLTDGIRSRTRNYLMPQKAQMMMCKRQLEENEMCAADELYCEDSPDGSFAPVSRQIA
ncbi:hypothetical protein E2C01_081881 [Portunus trituberculatus]|uniref:Uncharacterized protein n=1 Tax=Portunus trituberculatus TaxID=210409 RepID=A0A5B7IT13_PORTR|nr:hypothetical protein [Portunus trituberculatus]